MDPLPLLLLDFLAFLDFFFFLRTAQKQVEPSTSWLAKPSDITHEFVAKSIIKRYSILTFTAQRRVQLGRSKGNDKKENNKLGQHGEEVLVEDELRER